jgi:hypothetical protein
MSDFMRKLRLRRYRVWPLEIVRPGEFFGGIAVLAFIVFACIWLPPIIRAWVSP